MKKHSYVGFEPRNPITQGMCSATALQPLPKLWQVENFFGGNFALIASSHHNFFRKYLRKKISAEKFASKFFATS